MPICFARLLSPWRVQELTMIITGCVNAGLRRMRSATLNPSISGIWQSSKISRNGSPRA